MMKRASLGLFVLALFVFTACGSDSDGAQDQKGASVEVDDFEFVEESADLRVFRGKLHNTGDKTIRNAQVKVVLLDEDNRQIGAEYIPVQDIGQGERKSFRKVLDSDEDFRRARVQSVLVL